MGSTNKVQLMAFGGIPVHPSGVETGDRRGPNTRRFAVALVAAIFACGLAGSLSGTASAAPAKKKCPKGKVALVQDGKRTCAAAARFRQRATPPPSPRATLVEQLLSGGPVPLRMKNGKPARPAPPKALVSAVSKQYLTGEAQLVASLRAALAKTGNARSHELGFTGSTITKSADGTSATGSIGFGGSEAGHAISGSIQISADVSGRLDVGFDATVADPTGATKSTGFTSRDILKRGQECPTADGRLRADGGSDASSRSGETFGSKQVKLGGVRTSTTSSSKSTAQVQFGPNGKAKPFTFSVSTSLDSARSAQVLAFFSSRTRAVGSGTMTGTLDPATGKVSGATVTISARTSGHEQGTASADAAIRAQMEKALNDEVGRLLEKTRNAEKNCGGPYKVILALKTDSQFATHSASGIMNATLVATKSAPGVFKGSLPASYQNLVFTSKSDCAYINPVAGSSTFDVTITVGEDGSLRVVWSPGAGSTTTASVQCPGDPPATIPGQPGPTLLMPTPTEFELPNVGGQRAISGGFQSGGDGWTHSGTITVKRASATP